MTTLHSYLSYVDAPAALAWLERAFGFETVTRWHNDEGILAHAELRLDDAAIILFADAGEGYDRPTPKSNGAVGHGMYLAVSSPTDIDAVFERAVAAGAVVVWKPHMSEWDSYRCRVRDPEGYEWTFGTYKPGEPAGEW
jgi:uncharacterized glyoxalase superfamily protein PhnB